LLTVGSNFPYSQYLPEFDQARAVQIDHDPTMVGLRYPYEVNLVGDSAGTLRRLIPLLERRNDRRWRDTIEDNVARWWEVLQRRAYTEADPINPQLVFHELSSRLPEDAIIAADSGSAADWYARHIVMRGRMRGSLSGTLSSMGPGVPYVIGAKFGNPERPCVALVGDGAMQMNGINELITIAKYWQEWADPRMVIGVLHNNDLNQVTWELRGMGAHRSSCPVNNCPIFPTPAMPAASACTASGSTGPRTSYPPGKKRWPRTVRAWCSSSPTPLCRRSRPTRPGTRSRTWLGPCCTGTPTGSMSSRRVSGPRSRTSCRAPRIARTRSTEARVRRLGSAQPVTMICAAVSFTLALAHRSCRSVSGWQSSARLRSSRSRIACAV
jgi:hypothetical protein